MEERALGRSGLRVSAVGFGAWGIGGGMWLGSDDASAHATLRAALEGGCTFYDTALVYGDGHSESLVAAALKDWKRHVTVATKVPPKNRVWPAIRGTALRDAFPADYVRRCIEESAGRLERTIDLIQLHVWRDDWLADPGWPAVERVIEALMAAGTIRAFGISINDHDPASALEAVRRCELLTSVQVIYNVFDRSPEKELFPLCRERKVGVIARVPLDEGGLTGTIRPDTTFPPGDFRNVYFAGDRKAEVARRFDALRPLLTEEAASPVEGALRFCLSHPDVTTVIPGMRTVEHVRANLAVGDGRKLSPGLLTRLEAHAWPRSFYPVPEPPKRRPPLDLLGGLLALVLWIVLGFVVPVGSGAIHLLLAVGVLLVVRSVVTRGE